MGVKSITKHLNAAGTCTRDGGRWGIDAEKFMRLGDFVEGFQIFSAIYECKCLPAAIGPDGLDGDVRSQKENGV